MQLSWTIECARSIFIVWKRSFLYDKKTATRQFPVRWQFSIGAVFTADRKYSIISFRSSLLQVQSCPSRKLFSVVRNNAALIVLVDEVFDLIRFQNLYQCLYAFVVLVAFLNCNHVYILLDCFGISRLQSNCICTGQASLHSVVAVDNTEVNIFQSTGYLLRCKRNDLDVVRILNDVILCCGDTSFGIQLDQTLCLQ